MPLQLSKHGLCSLSHFTDSAWPFQLKNIFYYYLLVIKCIGCLIQSNEFFAF